jgi:uncharacterized protein (DUF488 family)
VSERGRQIEVFTIGVYGFTEDAFFNALTAAKIDTFCDVRRRRGVRGSEYAFANSARLQARLEQLGIRYLHFLELSPSNDIRKKQYEVDEAAHVGKRERTELSPQFEAAYAESCLKDFDSEAFVKSIHRERERPASRIVLFCVELEPAACHRSLLAERLHRDLGLPVTHLVP